MIKLTRSQQFLKDLEETLEWLCLFHCLWFFAKKKDQRSGFKYLKLLNKNGGR